MKTVIFGVVCAVLAFLLLLCTTAVSAKMMRQTEVAETLESAVDNAVDNCMNTITYSIGSRDEFVADVLQNILQEYHSTSEDIDVQIDYADEDKGILFLTASATYANVIGRTQVVSYQKQCLFTDVKMDDRYVINYWLDDGTLYRSYMASDGDSFPRPDEDPEIEGGTFLGWADEDGNLCTLDSDFPEEVTGPAAYSACFEITVVEAEGIAIGDCDETMYEGAVQQLTAEVTPEDSTETSLIWTSDDTSVCTVSSSGRVTAVGEGTTTIRVQVSGREEITAGVDITVIVETSISMSSSLAFDLDEGGTKAIRVTASTGDDLSAACSFESTDTSVATVDGAGNVTPAGAGTAYIKVQYRQDDPVYMPVMVATVSGWSGTYDGKAHSITATCPGAEITYGAESEPEEYVDVGTYTDSVTFKFEGLTLTGKATVEINQMTRTLTAWKADGSSAISSVTAEYPDTATFKIKASTMDEMDEATYTADTAAGSGTLFVSPDSNGAFTYSCTYIASDRDWEVTVTPTSAGGTGTLTFGAYDTETYAGSETTVTVKVGTGGSEVLVNADTDVGVTYDGNEHSISVTPASGFEGASITYSSDGGSSWSSECPSYTEAGTYTVMWEAELSGYATASGTAKLTINKASGSLKMEATANGGTIQIYAAENTSGGSVTATVPSNSVIKDFTDAGHSVYCADITGTAGSVTLTFTAAATDNYKAATATVTITVTTSGTITIE